ncbi:MAG: hypothetical protein KatS3mg057_2033 [Herpetosiphonaceae bacterium]|nr:MAG: hypothetical protein KatS3mg057_2033 [Herpetosiphonaceae bacterium]
MQRMISVAQTWLVMAALLAFLLPTGAAAQNAGAPIAVEVRIDRLQMHVGDQLTYELIVDASPEVEVSLPSIPSGQFGDWEVRVCETLPPDELPEDGLRSGWRCTLTIWTVGEHELPVQEVRYSGSGGTGSVRTRPLLVRVVSVLDESAGDIKPLKPQLPMNDPANLLLIVGLSILALLVASAVVLGFVYYRRMLPAPVAVGGPVPAVDPAQAALRELDRIAQLNLVAEGRIAEHYALIADVLRTYIRQLFGIPALERTTTEIGAALRRTASSAHPDTLVSLLAEADSVKFARHTPTPEEAYQMLNRARQTILTSRER